MKSVPQVLFTTYDGLTDPLGQSQILPYYKGLSKKGFQITILSCEKRELFNNNQELIQSICDEFNIDWQYEFYTKNPPIISTVIDLQKLKKKALKLHESKQFHIVHCRTVVTTNIGFALQEKGAKFIFDIRGFWADERVDGKLWDLNNPLFKIIYSHFKKKESKAYQSADYVITLTENAKNHLAKTYGLNSNIISVVPCTVDLNHFKSNDQLNAKSKELKKELGLLDNSPIICYSGSLGTRYMIDEMLSCFKTISKKIEQAAFLVITHSDSTELKIKIEQLDLKDKVVLTSTTYSEIPAYLLVADIALYFIFAGNSGKAVSPTKQAEFLSLGIPIITNSGIGDTEDIINKNKVGVVIDSFNATSFNSVTNQISGLMNLTKGEMTNIAQQKFDLNEGISTYETVYKKLLK